MIREAIILAGGLGTRMQSLFTDIPKPMAPINGKPFLEFILNYLIRQGIEKIILSVGYQYQSIQNYFGNQYKNISLTYSIEKDPLGTGGAIKKAFDHVVGSSTFALNGDTFFDIDLNTLSAFHIEKNSLLTLALKRMENFDRYGTVDINETGRITAFNEKKKVEKGLINGGIYILDKQIFNLIRTAEKFSFERDLMQKHYAELNCYGFPYDRYFIDIGIPEDYQAAKSTLPKVL